MHLLWNIESGLQGDQSLILATVRSQTQYAGEGIWREELVGRKAGTYPSLSIDATLKAPRTPVVFSMDRFISVLETWLEKLSKQVWKHQRELGGRESGIVTPSLLLAQPAPHHLSYDEHTEASPILLIICCFNWSGSFLSTTLDWKSFFVSSLTHLTAGLRITSKWDGI